MPSRLWVSLTIPRGVASSSISGRVELSTLPNIGVPMPCQTRPKTPSLRAGFSLKLSMGWNSVESVKSEEPTGLREDLIHRGISISEIEIALYKI